MTQLQDRTVVVQGPGGGGGGMGLGVVLGVILALVLGIAVLWVAFGGFKSGGPGGSTPAPGNTTDITIQTPDIKVPDSITVNTNTPSQ